jgi:SAM-dependent methyltransferase
MRLYNELAAWWPLLSSPDEYAGEAAFIRRTMVENCEGMPATVLELGSGGGNNAKHLAPDFALTLVDVAEPMLAVSRNLNPGCEHVAGDMRTVRLGRTFDAVVIHDAIMYMTSEADLRLALANAYQHCREGGVAIFIPDFTRENFDAQTSEGGHDAGGRGLRYLIWAFDPDPADTTYVEYFSLMLREGADTMTFEHERHLFGLFGHDDWLRWLREIGFDATSIRDDWGRDVFIGRKP